jgi:XTP/dITP diphosphohydrolase
MEKEIVFATNNLNKLKEVELLLKGSKFKILSLAQINCFDEIPETAATILENARMKSDYVFSKYNIDCFADDTGLEVFALNGEPGVRSARYAGEAKNDQANIDLLLEKLNGVQNRAAQFKTVISMHFNGKLIDFEGVVSGSIAASRIGDKGFGYDSVFIPLNTNKTFAQMTMDEKNLISHRAIAIAKMVDFLKNQS